MAIRIMLIILSAGYLALCICCLAEHRRRRISGMKYVCLPQFLLWIGAVTGGMFLGAAGTVWAQEASFGTCLCFSAFALLGMSLMLGWKNCFITYDKAGFTRKNLFGMQCSFTYDQVTAWRDSKHNPMESSLYADGKKISFNLLSDNGPDFLVTVSAGYRKTHGRKNLPQMPELRKDLGGFRAHVYNPGEYLVIFIMLLAFVVGTGAWLVLDSWLPVNEDDGELFHITFSSWVIEEDALFLSSSRTGEVFVLNGCGDYVSGLQQLIEKCDGETVFSVQAERFEPDDEAPFYRVYALSSGEEVYRTFEDSTAYKRRALPFTVGVFSIFLVILLAFSAFIYAVGSNPRKFPRWVVYCCFKKNAIDI